MKKKITCYYCKQKIKDSNSCGEVCDTWGNNHYFFHMDCFERTNHCGKYYIPPKKKSWIQKLLST